MTAMWAASPSELLLKAATKAAGRRRSVTRRRLPLIIGLVLLAIAILAVVFAPLLTSAPPNRIDVLHPLAPPGTGGLPPGTSGSAPGTGGSAPGTGAAGDSAAAEAAKPAFDPVQYALRNVFKVPGS